MKQGISAIAILAVLATAGCKEAPNPSAAPTDAPSEAASAPPPVETADEKSAKQLVGAWGTNGASCDSHGANFKANGDYSDGTYEGTWAVVDGVIKYTFNSEYDPYDDAGGKQKLSPAQTFTNKIVSLGENEFTVRRPDGATIVWKRCGAKAAALVKNSQVSNEQTGRQTQVKDNSGKTCGIATRTIWSFHDNTQGRRSSGVPKGTVIQIDECMADLGTCYSKDGEVYAADGLKLISCP